MARLDVLWTRELPDYATEVVWGRDGTTVALAMQSGPVWFLNAKDGSLQWATEGHAGGALSVSESPTEPVVATGGHDGTVALHTSGNPTPFARISVGRGWVTRIVWSDDGTLMAVAAGRAVAFFTSRGEPVGTPFEHPSTVTAMHWHASTRAWLTASYGALTFLRASTSEPLRRLYFRSSLLTADVSAVGGRFIASGTQDPLVHMWDLDDETVDVSLTGYRSKVDVLAWHPRAPLLATGSSATVIAWDVATQAGTQRPREIRPNVDRVSALTFLDDGTLLVGSDDGSLVSLDLDEEGMARPTTWRTRIGCRVCALVPDATGTRVVASCVGGLVRAFVVRGTS